MSDFVLGITLGFVLGLITVIVFSKGFWEWMKQ